jgi:hypothetical protein
MNDWPSWFGGNNQYSNNEYSNIFNRQFGSSVTIDEGFPFMSNNTRSPYVDTSYNGSISGLPQSNTLSSLFGQNGPYLGYNDAWWDGIDDDNWWQYY